MKFKRNCGITWHRGKKNTWENKMHQTTKIEQNRIKQPENKMHHKTEQNAIKLNTF